MKNCKSCLLTKDLSEFGMRSDKKHLYKSHCKPCMVKTQLIYKTKLKENGTYKCWSVLNKEASRLKTIEWRKANPDKMKQYQKKYQQANLNKIRALNAKRKADKIQATPKWLTEDQINEIKMVYINKPEGYEVDHIEPLRGKEVRGLHVPWNLQYLTINENRVKSNRRAA